MSCENNNCGNDNWIPDSYYPNDNTDDCDNGNSNGGGSSEGSGSNVDNTIYVESVSITPINKTLKKGEWYYGYSASVCPFDADNRSVWWYSENPYVASINQYNGAVYANGVGSTKLHAVASDGSYVEDSVDITVIVYGTSLC